ncbi:hypothetical protein BKK56_00775 [Rodentibacter genomosp. 2]|nr:hypothetical protein BKK56_00775 [Rodentibacter genomosp. 2]
MGKVRSNLSVFWYSHLKKRLLPVSNGENGLAIFFTSKYGGKFWWDEKNKTTVLLIRIKVQYHISD